jgi:LPXTG-site transpeptidase (sortase) family protein
MSEKPLLLEPTKAIVVARAQRTRTSFVVRLLCAAFGALAVMVGFADISTRIAHRVFGDNASMVAFAPVALLNNQPAASAPESTSTPKSPLPAGTGMVPVRIKIPSIGVDANVEQVGLKADGSMDTPKDFGDTAWYKDGPLPGTAGNAVIDGHVNNALTKAGVFENLSKVNAGDYVSVYDAQGHALLYSITRVGDYPYDNAHLAEVFSSQGPSQLVIITCDGDWVSSAHSYNQRLVVYAVLITK